MTLTTQHTILHNTTQHYTGQEEDDEGVQERVVVKRVNDEEGSI